MDKNIIFEKIDSLREEMVRDLQSLIRCRSVLGEAADGAPFGEGVAKAYDTMMKMAKREGFEVCDFDGYGGHIDFCEASKDSGSLANDNIFGILCHLDVVSEGSGWTHEPFSGEIIDGTMYGRGTLDDKGPTIAAFYAMKALKDCGVEPAGKIRMIIGLDEETKSAGMEYYKEHVDRLPDKSIVPDSDFPLIQGEKGIMIFDIAQKIPDAGKSAKGMKLSGAKKMASTEKMASGEKTAIAETILSDEKMPGTENIPREEMLEGAELKLGEMLPGEELKPGEHKMHLIDISGGNAANMVPDFASARIVPSAIYMSKVENRSANEPLGEDEKKLIDSIASILSKMADVSVEDDEIVVKCFGKSAHGAMPLKGKNAISKLIKVLGSIEFDAKEINDLIKFYNEKIGSEINGKKIGLGHIKDDISGDIIWNTGMIKYIKADEADKTCKVIEAGEADETETDKIILTVNVRVPVTFSDRDVFDVLRPQLALMGATTQNAIYKPSLYFDSENETVKILLDVYRENTNDNETEPLVIGGGTYAREIPNAIAFGALYPGDPDTMHEADECVKIDRLVQTTKIYADALLRLAVGR